MWCSKLISVGETRPSPTAHSGAINTRRLRYGQFLTPAQFHAAFSPRSEDVALVASTLSALGFQIKHIPDSGLFVAASGTVEKIKQALG